MDVLLAIHNLANVVFPNDGNAFDSFIEMNEDEYELVVSNRILIDKKSISKLLSIYNISELFDLSNCYLGTLNERFEYWHITKKSVNKIKTAYYRGFAHQYRDREENKLYIPSEYYDDYYKYLSLLNKWGEQGIEPDDSVPQAYTSVIPYDEFDKTIPYAKYYWGSSSIRKRLIEEDWVPLKDVVELYQSDWIDNNFDINLKVNWLDLQNIWSYPYIPELHTQENFRKTTVVLRKGDIIWDRETKFFLIDKDSQEDIYAPIGLPVIRPKGISPEYLYFYLNSSFVKNLIDRLTIRILDSVDYNPFRYANFPVVLPKEPESYYKERFEEISAPNKRFYTSLEASFSEENVESIINAEVVSRLKLNNEQLLRTHLEDDVKELNVCFNHKAYKATLTLAGSILEALLIDWLSEIDNKDYVYKEPFKVPIYDSTTKDYVRDADGKIKMRKANLYDYIEAIKDKKKEEWSAEAIQADFIRKKRNLIHTKLCLINDESIDEKTCREVIDSLNSIVSSRLK